MRIIFIIFLVVFTMNLRADDIQDLQIEGLSVGDSLLEYFNRSEIEKNKRNYLSGKRNFYAVGGESLDLKSYDSIDIYLKTDDNQFKIYMISAFIFYEYDYNKCEDKQNEIVADIRNILTSSEIIESGDIDHQYDKTGLSRRNHKTFLVNSDYLKIECLNWSNEIEKKHPNWTDHLSVSVITSEIEEWLSNGYP